MHLIVIKRIRKSVQLDFRFACSVSSARWEEICYRGSNNLKTNSRSPPFVQREIGITAHSRSKRPFNNQDSVSVKIAMNLNTTEEKTEVLGDGDRIRPLLRSCIVQILSKRLVDPVKVRNQEDPVVSMLIMDYFNWIGYTHSAEMLNKESVIAFDYQKLTTFRENLGHFDGDFPVLLSAVLNFMQTNAPKKTN